MADLIDGQSAAEALKADLAADIAALKTAGTVPALASLLVGDDAGSRVYRRQLERVAQDLGITHRAVELSAAATVVDVLAAVRHLNADPQLHGILPLRPLPAGLPESAVLETLDPAKDVDGLHPINVGRLVLGQPVAVPATAMACFHLLDRYFRSQGLDPAEGFAGRHLVIVGRSQSVGRPAYALALQRNATPTTVHSFTSKAGRLADHTRGADILIVAMGRPGAITGEMVKPGAVVIDVGINVVPVLDQDRRPILDDRGRPKRAIVGDVAFDEVRAVVAAITPVPGGVGAVTNLLLMRNVVIAARPAVAS